VNGSHAGESIVVGGIQTGLADRLQNPVTHFPIALCIRVNGIRFKSVIGQYFGKDSGDQYCILFLGKLAINGGV